MRKVKRLLLLFALLTLAGCIPENKTQSNSEDIVQTTIAGQTFRIPKSYLQTPYPKYKGDYASILIMYPDFKPPKETPQALWKKGVWYQNVDIHIKDSKGMASIKEAIDNKVRFDNLTNIVGIQYGLTYRSYPEGSKIQRSEIWIEDGNTSYISCSLQVTLDNGNTTFPQCKHRFRWKNQSISLSIDKRLLPHWKEIKENVIRLLEEFEINPKTSMEGKNGTGLH